jgi:hypothetical protein
MKPRNKVILFLITMAIPLAGILPAAAQISVPVNVNGQAQTGGSAPPDPNAAAGPNYIVEYVNNNSFSIYNKSGGFVSITYMDSFFGFQTGGDGHVIYDENSGRFAIEILGTNSTVGFAVSDTSDPTGSWHKTVISVPGLWDGYGGNGIGYNADAYVVHVNGFYNQFAVIAASNNVNLAYTLVNNAPGNMRIGRPVPMAGAAPGDPFYFVEANGDGANGTGGTPGVIEVVAISNILSASRTYTDYQVPADSDNVTAFNTSWRNNQLAVVGPINSQVGWYLLNTTNGVTFAQGGRITPPDGGGVNDPSIAIAPNGDMGVNYVAVAAAGGAFTPTYITGRAATDPVGTMRPSVAVVSGPISDGRYGDYSSCVSDLNSSGVAQNTFWACNEYFNTLNMFDWRTRLANFSIPVGAFAPAPTGLTAIPGDTHVSLSWTSSGGATSYYVKRALMDGGPYTTIASTGGTTFYNSGLVDGTAYYYAVSAVNGSGEGANSGQVSVTPQGATATVFGFETPVMASGNYQYNPLGSPWTFNGAAGNGSGMVANGSGFGNPNAPQGVQAAFVQSNGVISQVLSGFAIGTSYTITYSAAQRSGNAQSWNVTIDGTVIKSNTPGSTSYSPVTATFMATAVTHTLAFVGTDLAGGDNTVFIDNIRITPALNPVAPVVTLTTPANNASIMVPPAINLAANVVTNGNLISSVQFYCNGNNLIGQDASPPYSFSWNNPISGTYSVFARVTYNGGSVVDSPAAAINILNTNVNFSFETPSLGGGNFQYNPSGGSWAFGGVSGNGSGIVANGSGFSNPNAPLGTQAAFVQTYGSVSQLLYGFTPGTNYTITYSAAQRSGANQNGGESWNVTVDGAVIETNNPGPGATSYVNYTASFTATAAAHTLAFVGTDLAGGDNTVFIDNVRISPPVSQVPPSVVLTSPANNAVFSAANPVNLAATVATNGNTIAGVRFYSNTSNLIAQVTAPYAYAWSNANAGASTVFARLVFNGGSTVDSSMANITVTNPPPAASGIRLGVEGQTLSISGIGLASRPYCLNTASNLAPPVVWTPIQTNISDASGNIFFTNIAPANGEGFFRVSAP